jgi:hypothetical protein
MCNQRVVVVIEKKKKERATMVVVVGATSLIHSQLRHPLEKGVGVGKAEERRVKSTHKRTKLRVIVPLFKIQ